MRVLYDGSIFNFQELGGINRYFSNLIDNLPSGVAPTLTTTRRNRDNFPRQPRLDIRCHPRFAFRPGRVAYWAEKFYFRAVSRGFDVVHPTYYSLLTQLPWKAPALRGRLVVTVYDMIHERFPQTPVNPTVALKKGAIEAAAAILCISQQTRRDLLEYYPALDPAKVHVTYLASEVSREIAVEQKDVPPSQYLLYVGGRDVTYKNFDGLLRAFARLGVEHRELCLWVVGGGPFTSDEILLATQLGIKDRLKHLGNLDDAELAGIYQHARLFVYPSLYEGFGIPPLEAMACGAPVIVADCSSLPEVVGQAALLFDPSEEDGLERAIVRLLSSSSLCAEMVARGFEQAAKFSWSKTASQTVAVYESLAGALVQ